MQLSILGAVIEQFTAAVPPVVKVDLTGKTVIVTGANIGIGLETAKHFATMNPAKLIVTCRNKQKGDETVSNIHKTTGYAGTLEAWVLDLADFASVKAFAERFEKDGGERLDILVENAALATRDVNCTKDGWEESTQINDLSTFLLALLLLPRMLDTATKFSTVPRIVVVTSGLHYWAKFDTDLVDAPNFWRKYAHQDFGHEPASRYPETKLLNLMFVRALDARLHRKPLIVNAPDPGYCVSALRRSWKGLRGWLGWFMDIILARTAEEGSRQFIWAAVGREEEGRRDELRGAFITTTRVQEASDWLIGEEGVRAQDKIWDDLVEELILIEPRIDGIVNEYLTAPVKR